MSDIIPAADLTAMQQRLIAATRESGRWPPHPFSWEELDRLIRYVGHLEAELKVVFSAAEANWTKDETRIAELKQLVASQAERIAAQAELLARKGEAGHG